MTVEVSVPAGPRVRVRAALGGAFALVSESDAAVRRVEVIGLTPE